MPGILTKLNNIEVIKNLARDFEENPHYVFVSKQTEYLTGDEDVPLTTFAPDACTTVLYDSMIFAKKILPSDIMFMVPRAIWTSGEVYSSYRRDDPNIFDSPFYVAHQIGSNFYVYKCLENNNGSDSTEAPTGTDPAPFITSDGYIWKYMYTFTDLEDEKFSTADTMPCKIDDTVRASAINGTIDAIHIESNSSQYTNWHKGSFTADAIRVNGDELLYALELPASTYNNFYNGCYMKIVSGLADGEYRKIVDYYTLGDQKVVQLESAFTITPAVGTQYEVMPAIVFESDGYETIQCAARAVISNTNTIENIEILSPGRDYRKAEASVYADPVVGITLPAEIAPVVSPIGGHGADALAELGASYLSIGIMFNQDENGRVSAENDYRIIGIIKEPTFSGLNVVMDLANTDGVFLSGETVKQCKRIEVPGTYTVSSLSHFIVSGTNTAYEYFSNNDLVLLTDGSNRFISEVDYVAAANTFRIKDLPAWSNSGCSISILTPLASATINSIDDALLVLGSVSSNFVNTNPILVGLSSHAVGNIDFSNNSTLSINTDNIVEFRSFSQLTKLTGVYSDANTFPEDMVISSGSGTAVVHSTTNDEGIDVLFINDLSGSIEPGMTLTSSESLTSFEILNKYPGWLTIDSGKIIYLETISPVLRSQNTSELIKVVFGL